jgi:hypothetical protein
MTRDARSSPIHELPDANPLDGTEIIAIEQLLDPTKPWIGTRDVQILLTDIGNAEVIMSWHSGEPMQWHSGEEIDWHSP